MSAWQKRCLTQNLCSARHCRCAPRLLKPALGFDLLDVIHAPEHQREEMTARLKDTSLAQPAIFAIGYALAKQWDHWGIGPM